MLSPFSMFRHRRCCVSPCHSSYMRCPAANRTCTYWSSVLWLATRSSASSA